MAAETQTLKHEKHLRILAIAARILMQVYKVLYVLKSVATSCISD
jgi:hypothetical protein